MKQLIHLNLSHNNLKEKGKNKRELIIMLELQTMGMHATDIESASNVLIAHYSIALVGYGWKQAQR